jgi:hypothetical protein
MAGMLTDDNLEKAIMVKVNSLKLDLDETKFSSSA